MNNLEAYKRDIYASSYICKYQEYDLMVDAAKINLENAKEHFDKYQEFFATNQKVYNEQKQKITDLEMYYNKIHKEFEDWKVQEIEK